MLAILFLVRLLGRRPLACSISGALVGKQTLVSLRDQALALVAMILMQGLITWGVIWCAYGLRYAALNPACSSPGDTLPIPWETVLSSPSLPIRAIAFARDHHLMPEAYLFGFAHSFHFSLQRVSFLNGEYSLTGFPEFFPYCLLAKAPPELFVLLLLGGATLLWRRFAPSQTDATSPSPALPDVATPLRSILYELTPLLTITAVYWAVALRTKLNIGDRHLLPIYPPMLMLAGASAVHFARTFPRAKAVVALALAGFALESLLIYPHHLSYFSPLVGGPRQGYRHLVDSSLDWGQDLPALQKWIDRESAAGGPAKPVYLSYFGLASAPYHKVKATLLTSNLLQVIPRGPVDYQPGIYCFSASMLQGVYSDASVNLFGRWNTKYESDYQRLLPYMNRFAAARDDAAAQQALVKEVGGEEAWIMGCRRFEALKLARLAAALRRREPDDYAGYSILIYRLSAPELDAALHGQPAELVAEPR
ncbi:MAG: hypothetical protein NTW19_00630 [Planctomycetota bacterium]|nr:hypothetical protein [Planctomycetota bacterium]